MNPSTDFVDISSAQNPTAIDWPQMGAAGILGAYIRCGYGLKPDNACAAHVAGVKSINRDFGLYLYAILDASDPELQAEALMLKSRAHQATWAPSVDLEDPETKKSGEQIADWIDRFNARCVEINPDQKIVFYTGSWLARVPAKRSIAWRNHALWVASYTRPLPHIPYPWDEIAAWQHSANTIWSDGSWGPKPKDPNARIIAQPGKIAGFNGEIDCNALGNVSMEMLRQGVAPRTPLDLRDPMHRQRALRRLGYDPGSPDGAFGPRSIAALKLAQRDLKVDVNGIWTPNTEWAIAEKLEAA